MRPAPFVSPRTTAKMLTTTAPYVSKPAKILCTAQRNPLCLSFVGSNRLNPDTKGHCGWVEKYKRINVSIYHLHNSCEMWIHSPPMRICRLIHDASFNDICRRSHCSSHYKRILFFVQNTKPFQCGNGIPKPAQIDAMMCTVWQSGRPVLVIIVRLAQSYVVRSPKLTNAARCTFGMLPFHRPLMPPRSTICRNACAALLTRGSKPIKRRFPSIWQCTFTKSAGDAILCPTK